MKTRLDIELVKRGIVNSRSQAESFVRLERVKVNGQIKNKPGFLVARNDDIVLKGEQYVSRAGLKLSSVAKTLKLDFKNKVVLDVGSSTGGFTDYALKHGAKRVVAVDVGSDQLHPLLKNNPSIELHEKTDIRDFKYNANLDLVLIDVSFISMRSVLPSIASLCSAETMIVGMVKPQFEAGSGQKNKGVIKNEALRRDIFKDFEAWLKSEFVIIDKADSQVTGEKGNRERFYLLKKLGRS